jgi:hypothetical protein
MATQQEALRDWHRLFGLLLTDFFTNSPFTVDVEPDLSVQQQRLDVVLVRRRRGRFTERPPGGFDPLAAHNLITFKSHHEALNPWAMKELISHDVAYRKLVSRSPSDLLPDDHFRLYAVAARLPHNLSGQVPWQQIQTGVYDCRWGTDTIRVVVAGELPREPHNAPLHLFSASAELVTFGRGSYRPRSELTSGVLGQLFERLQGEGFTMPFTMHDFLRGYIQEHFPQLTPEEQGQVLERLSPERRREILLSRPPEERRELLQSLPAEELLGVLSPERIQQYLEQVTRQRPAQPPKQRRKK